MASNFDFVNREPQWVNIAERARKAEQGMAVAPEVVQREWIPVTRINMARIESCLPC